jgi:hypothetical protein
MPFSSRLSLVSLVLTFSCLAVHATANENCLQYDSRSCLFGAQVTVGNTRCKPRPCNFPSANEFGQECAFSETGTYSVDDSCADPFLSTTRSGASPCGEERCCSTSSPGSFTPDGTYPNGAQRFSYQPLAPESCRYSSYTRGQVMATLESIKAPLVVIGDSMMRQLFLRLVMMMRGQQRLLGNDEYISFDILFEIKSGQ